MTVSYRSLPSIQALRCFETAARLGSFTLAADEMCITHSAISHQIRGLEEMIGQPLFVRQGNRMALTDVGRSLAIERGEHWTISVKPAQLHTSRRPRPQTLNLAAQNRFNRALAPAAPSTSPKYPSATLACACPASLIFPRTVRTTWI